eukprot:scaffold77430_cov19-Tisochrysis_lutea.AAC.1
MRPWMCCDVNAACNCGIWLAGVWAAAASARWSAAWIARLMRPWMCCAPRVAQPSASIARRRRIG